MQAAEHRATRCICVEKAQDQSSKFGICLPSLARGAAQRLAKPRAAMYKSSAQLANVHEDGVWAVAWSPNGQVVTGSCDELVQTYMVHGQDIEKKHQLRGHQLGVCSVSVSEGGLAASSALDSHIRLWDLESGAERGVIDAGPVEAWTVSLSPDGRLVASGSQGGNINLWNVEGGEKQHTFETGGKFAMSVAISPDGTKVACGAADGGVPCRKQARYVHGRPARPKRLIGRGWPRLGAA